MDEEKINEICINNGLRANKIAKYPTWIDKNNQEGIDIQSGKIHTFKIVNLEKVYDDSPGEAIKKILSLINERSSKNESSPNGEQKKEEKCEYADDKSRESCNTKDLFKRDQSLESSPALPEFLTSALMSKWAKMTTTDRVLLFQKTPADKVKMVKVGKNEKGEDVMAPYVEGNYMFKEANAAFLFDWYLADRVITVSPTGVSCTGTLFVWFSEYNKYLSRPATGYQETNKKVDIELAKKGATTDAIKKALSLFGFNSDVYSGEREG